LTVDGLIADLDKALQFPGVSNAWMGSDYDKCLRPFASSKMNRSARVPQV
jgi:hypothetical protein